MRFLHLSDLHLGKRVNEFSMLEDQAYILKEILNIIDEQKVEAVLIAGDIYDKVIPSAEAVRLLDDFLTRIAARELPVFLISGNHDSAERIAFGSRLMSSRQIYLSPVFESDVEPVTISDRYGEINIYMLPFVKPSLVKRVYPEEEIITYQDAVNAAVQHMQIDTDKRNILLAHQFVTGAARCDSEELSVGGVDDVDASVFDGFDYVALGHLHGPQKIGKETVRYSGTPLKYSFSETNHKKAAVIVDVEEKGKINIQQIPFLPKHDMREVRGTYMEVTALDFYKDMNTDDYLHITLTDEEDIPDAMDMARDAIGIVGIDMEDSGELLPEASRLAQVQKDAPEGAMVSFVDIDFTEYRRKNELRTVKKNCTVPSWLCYEAERAGVNFSAVLQAGLKRELHITD